MNYFDKNIYEFGFKYHDKMYCWKNKKLYRMPFLSNRRSYRKKELSIIYNSGVIGYFIDGKFKSLRQLKDITKKVNYTIEELRFSDCPF